MKFLDAAGITTLVNKLKTKFQETLVSGTNIKTVNGNSLLGSGDITISGGGSTPLIAYTNGSSLYADEQCKTPFKEVYGWDYDELYTLLTEADKFIIRGTISGNPCQWIPAEILYDPIEPEIRIYIWHKTSWKNIGI